MSISIPEASITVSADRWASEPPKKQDYEHTVAIVIIRGDIAKTKCGELVLRRIKGGPGSVEVYPRYDRGHRAYTFRELFDGSFFSNSCGFSGCFSWSLSPAPA